MKKTLFALTAAMALAILGLANADVILGETTIFDQGNRVVTVEADPICWLKQMEELFTEYEPSPKGQPLWEIKATLDPSMNCEAPGE